MGIQQWIRKAELLITNGKITVDLSNLHFKFTTKAAVIGTPKILQLRVYNVAPNTIKQILNEGLEVQLSAGYEGNSSLIFSGQIRQINVGKENGVDTFLDIQATDSDRLFSNGFVSMTVNKGSNLNQRLYGIAQEADVKIDYTGIDDKSELPRGRVYHGRIRNHLRTATAQTGTDWHIENGGINIIARNGYLSQEVQEINKATGMIGLPMQTIEGIHVKCLLNPSIKIGCPIKLDNGSVQYLQQGLSLQEEAQWNLNISPLSPNGIYKVLYINHEGDIRGQSWYSNVICYSIEPGLTPSALKYSVPQ